MELSRLILLAALLLLTACAGDRYHREGLNLVAEGKHEEGIARLEQAVKEEPDNPGFRIDLYRQRTQYINRLLSTADHDRFAGKLESSEALYRRVLQMEPPNSRARSGLERIDRERRHTPLIELAKEAFKDGEVEKTELLLKPVLAEDPSSPAAVLLKRQIEELRTKAQLAKPILRIGQQKPISIEFRDANLKMVFEAIARTSGVNFILDKDIRPDLRTTVFLRQASLEDAIDLILQTNRLEKKVLNSNTILIYPNTVEKLKEYQELVVKGFYLENADPKRTEAMIKALLKTKDVFVDEKLNLLVVRDTPEAIKLAEKLVAMHDMYEPEVMLEVEVLEVKRSRLLELGIQWPGQVTLAPLGTSGTTTLTDLKSLNSDRIGVTLPNAIVNLRREIGDANILANPRIRAKNREKATVMIGDKVPVITTTTSSTGFVSENAQYLDVGIKLEVQPDIHLQDDVAIKIGLEVSSLVRELRTPAGSLAYQIGSRSASTVLRLKDGETQVLAGLISDEDRSAANRVPGLGDIPILGRLFSSQKDDGAKTEIVLSITPRLIRNINRPEASTSEFWSGTESSLRTKPLAIQSMRDSNDDAAMPISKDKVAPAAAIGNSGTGLVKKEPTSVSLALHGPAQVKAGEEFKLALRIKSDGALTSLPFQMSYDPTAFQITQITEGLFFKQDDAKASISSNIDASAGKVFGTVVRSATDGAQGEDNVAVIVIRALPGKAQGEVKVLSATPITNGGNTVVPVLPPPLIINIGS